MKTTISTRVDLDEGITPALIMQVVKNVLECNLATTRKRELVECKKIATGLSQKYLDKKYTLEDLMKEITGKDKEHAMYYYYIRKCDDHYEAEPKFKLKYDTCLEHLEQLIYKV